MVEALVFGLLAGWIYSFAPLLALDVAIAFSPLSLGFILLVAALCTFPRRCWHFRMHALRGSLLGVAATAVLLGALPQGIASEFGRLEGGLFSLAVGALLGALSCTLLLGAITALAGRPIPQDGTRCPKCAYLIVHLPTNRCPECGTAFSDSDIAPISRSSGPEWRRAAARALLCAAIFGALYLAYPHVLTELLVRSATRSFPRDLDLVWMSYLNCRPKAAARALAACLERDDLAQRARGADVISYLKGPNELLAHRLVRHARTEPDSRMRQICLGSLACIDARRLSESMPEFLADRDPMVRWTALASLAAGGSAPRALGTPWLISALDDLDEQVRVFAYKRLCDNTRQHIPFEPAGPRDQRLRQQAAWQDWWKSVAGNDHPLCSDRGG